MTKKGKIALGVVGGLVLLGGVQAYRERSVPASPDNASSGSYSYASQPAAYTPAAGGGLDG